LGICYQSTVLKLYLSFRILLGIIANFLNMFVIILYKIRIYLFMSLISSGSHSTIILLKNDIKGYILIVLKIINDTHFCWGLKTLNESNYFLLKAYSFLSIKEQCYKLMVLALFKQSSFYLVLYIKI
jgi:hypothetical protein